MAVAAAVALVFAVLAAVPARADAGRVVLDDSFTGKTIDPANWIPQVGRASKSSEVFQPSNDVVDGSGLHLLVRRASTDSPVVSGGVISRASMRYGTVDVLARLPKGDGLWPTLWLRGYDSKGRVTGEIDLFEAFGSHTSALQSTVHHWHNGQDSAESDCALVGWNRPTLCHQRSWPKADFHAAYHHYGLDWKPGKVTFLFDGTPYYTTRWDVPSTSMELVMNVQVGGFWDGWPDESTQFPTSMDITHVRLVSLT